MTRRSSRTLWAAALLAGALAVLLVPWFLSGWADVRAQQREVREAPARAARDKGDELALELRGELARVLSREVERPYFHYQNLFHDPRSGDHLGVTPSPLASGPDDPLVLGYFQLDAKGRLSTPTINEDLPQLSEPRRLAENRQFRDEVVRGFAAELAPPRIGTSVLVASADPEPVAPVPRPPVPRRKVAPRANVASIDVPAVEQRANEPPPSKQVIQIDQSSYAQNNDSNQAFMQQNAVDPSMMVQQQQPWTPPRQVQQQQQQPPQPLPPPPPPQPEPPEPRAEPQQLAAPSAEAANHRAAATEAAPGATSAAPPPRAPRPRRVAPAAAPATPPGPITITISPLEWHTFPYAGAPALVAVRHVETPDGSLAQGFVVDRAAMTRWLAGRAGDSVAELVEGDEAGAAGIAPGWHLSVAANPRVLAQAASAASLIARDFVLRFVLVGIVALLAAAGVVLLVARAERLARERSQFAAAAAHELRTPLAGLQLYGDMLADGLGDPAKLRDYARRMSEEAARLGRVVSNVLGFSQLERGNLSVEARPGNLGEVLGELAERALPALDRAGAVLALEVSPDLEARFDRDAVVRIVGNLLDNAEKYSRGAEDRTITLAGRALADRVEIEVSDRGPGIAPAARGKLFRAFSRGVSSDGPAGLGLGLALSQSLARAMGGELEYRPVAGGGATFVLSLARS
ncbi:MAG: sensor histidine kinase [Kofleriaceae bacterium]